jgi:hypothetical protein
MYCLIVLPFLLQYLTNAENLISSSFVTSKLTLKIPNNLIYLLKRRIKAIPVTGLGVL